MGLKNINKKRAILVVGKTGTGKTTKAKTFVNDPIIFYGSDEINFDLGSFPVERCIIIEDIHYKPRKDMIKNIIRQYRGQVVLTSINKKSVKWVHSMCQVKLAGSTKHLENEIKQVAPNSEPPMLMEKGEFELIYPFMKSKNRDKIKDLLLYNEPKDYSILNLLVQVLHPTRLILIDSTVKRRWHKRYFYEMLAYCHEGGGVAVIPRGKPRTDKAKEDKRIKDNFRSLSRKLKVKDVRVFQQLCKDNMLKDHFKKKLSHSECRLLNLGEKKKPKKKEKITVKQMSIEEFL